MPVAPPRGDKDRHRMMINYPVLATARAGSFVHKVSTDRDWKAENLRAEAPVSVALRPTSPTSVQTPIHPMDSGAAGGVPCPSMDQIWARRGF